MSVLDQPTEAMIACGTTATSIEEERACHPGLEFDWAAVE